MSIVSLRKVTIAAPESQRAETLDALQQFGALHLRSLGTITEAAQGDQDQALTQARHAIRYLRKSPQHLSEDPALPEAEAADIVSRTLAVERQRRHLHDAIDEIDLVIRQLAPWGEFKLPPPEALGGYRFWFFTLPALRAGALQTIKHGWRVVRRDKHRLYVVVVAREAPALPGYFQPHDLPQASLSELRARRRQHQLALEDLGLERLGLTRWMGILRGYCHLLGNRRQLNRARDQLRGCGAFFVLAAWLPQPAQARLTALCRERGWACVIERVSERDRPPTLLDNPEWVSGGSSLMGFFQLPGYRNWDPTPVVFASFALFFAVILSDAGYALALGAGLWLARKRWARRRDRRAINALLLTMVGTSVLFGVLVGSYFGLAPAPDSLWSAVAVIDLQNFDDMMRLSIACGVVHLVIANTMRGIARWPDAMAWHCWGWSVVCLSAFVYWLAYIQALDERWQQLAMLVGALAALAVFWYADPRPLQNSRAGLWRVLSGTRALAAASKLFGDVLSYMRLFALGLASATLAITFNQLAQSVYEQWSGIGLLFAGLLLLVGHLLNFVLAVMGGVVHGMRLILIEFLAWAVADEGYRFEAFRKEEAS